MSTTEARFGSVTDPDGLDPVTNIAADIVGATSPIAQKAARFDALSSLPGAHISGRFVWLTGAKQLYYDDGATFTLQNIATALGGNTPAPIQAGGTANEGTSTAAARLDHDHALPTGPPRPSAPGDAGSQGASGKVADADHIHQREAADPTTWLSSITLSKQGGISLISGTYALAGYITPVIPPVVAGQNVQNAARQWQVEARMVLGNSDGSNFRMYLGGGALPPPLAASPAYGGGGGSNNDVVIPSCVVISSQAGLKFDLFYKYDEQLWFVAQGRSVNTLPITAGDMIWVNASYRTF